MENHEEKCGITEGATKEYIVPELLTDRKYVLNIKHMLLSAILTVLCAGVIFFAADCFPGVGGKIFTWTDGLQGTGNLEWRKFLAGESNEYTFTIGMGNERSSPYLVDPVAALINLATDDINLVFFIWVLIKCSLAAAAFNAFIQYLLRKNEVLYIALSVAYALSGYFYGFYMVHEYLNVNYFFPVIMIFVLRYIRTGKWFLLSLAYGFSFFSFFYSSYISGVFSFICFCGLLFFRYGKDIKKITKTGLIYAFSVIVGMFVATSRLLPVVMQILRNDSINDEARNFEIITPWDFVSNFFIGQYQSFDNPYPMLYCGMLPLFLCICFFLDKNIEKKVRFFAAGFIIFLLCCTFFRPFYRLIQFGAEPNSFAFRFSFGYPFFVCVLAGVEFGSMKKRRGILIIVMLFISIYLITMLWRDGHCLADNNGMSIEKFFIHLAVTSLGAVLVWNTSTIRSRKMVCLLTFIMILECIINGILIEKEKSRVPLIYCDVYEMWKKKGDEGSRIIKEKAEEDGVLFCRVDELNAATFNQGGKFGYNTISTFDNMTKQSVRLALQNLGYAGSARVLFGQGGTEFTRMIFAVRYNLSVLYKPDEDPESYLVERYDEPLSVGFMVSDYINSYKGESENAFENNNELASMMLGRDCFIFRSMNEIDPDAQIEFEDDGIEAHRVDDSFVLVRSSALDEDASKGSAAEKENSEGEKARLKLYFPDENEKMYAYLSKDRNNPSVYDTTWPVVYSEGGSQTMLNFNPYLSMPYIIKLGKNEEGKVNVVIYKKFKPGIADYFTFKDIYAYCLDEDALKEFYNEMSLGNMTVTEAHENMISGKVTATEDKPVLFTSVPYSIYWNAYVDGEKAEITPVMGDAFISLRLTPGEHDVKLYYHNPVFPVSIMISVSTIVLLAVAYIILKRKAASQNTQKSDE
ncbi:MAG: YfhO family protein [Lachnospiraceae bacterium]|nr:YfhO family protein [Lachnospiraceae bacterium]